MYRMCNARRLSLHIVRWLCSERGGEGVSGAKGRRLRRVRMNLGSGAQTLAVPFNVDALTEDTSVYELLGKV